MSANCTFIRPPTCSASAILAVCCSSRAIISGDSERGGSEQARIAGMNAGLLDMLHHPGDKNILAVAQAVDIHLDSVGEIAVEQQRILAEHRIDLAGLVIGVARLDVGRHKAGQGAEQIVVQRAERRG